MLNEVLPTLPRNDQKHLIGRLDRPNDGCALQAAWELAVLWSLQRQFVADMRVTQRERGRPDCRVAIGAAKPMMVEIYAPTGQTFAFKDQLDAATTQLRAIAERAAPGTSEHLRITYHEWRRVSPTGHTMRVPSIAADAPQHPQVIAALETFWRSGATRERVSVDGQLFATVERTPYRLAGLNYSCQIPASPQSVVGTFSQTMIDKAKRQLGPFQPDHFTALVVCDGGNAVISDPRQFRPGMSPSGADVIAHVLEQSGIDIIVCVGRVDRMVMGGMVLSPMNTRAELTKEFFVSPSLTVAEADALEVALDAALSHIPVPQIPPYRSKSLQDQEAAGAPKLRNIHSFQVTSNARTMEIKLSARAVMELLRGSTSMDAFRETHMRFGPCDFPQYAITDIAIVRHNDTDDDQVVVTLSKDPTAHSFAELVADRGAVQPSGDA